MSSDLRNVLILAVVVLLASVVGFVPEDEPQVVTNGGPLGATDQLTLEDENAAGGAVVSGGGGTGGGGGTAEGATGGATPQEVEEQLAQANQDLACEAGRNGGETDTGVTGNRIGLASTIVTSGPGSTFLADSQYGMQAIVAKANSAGGICGRGLDLQLVNDNWEAQRGHNILRNFMNDGGIFALPVVPSSEGLRAAGPDIEKSGIPVIGSDGMLEEQYTNDWIWPVATATVSQMRIMVDYAASQGAENFAIVFDDFYRFGVEGRDAYERYVKKAGNTFVHAEGIQPNQAGYGPQIANLNDACGGGKCDVVVMLLDPGSANTWIAGDQNFKTRAKYRFGAQPLFSDNFAQDCGGRCDGMLVWSGYVPPLGNNQGLAGIREYSSDVKAVAPSADVSNQFLEGAYLGMSVFVEALQQVGPNLTRERLRDVMNSMTYESDLSSNLTWSADKRLANTSAQAWEIKAASGSFDGFRDARTGFIKDPDPNI